MPSILYTWRRMITVKACHCYVFLSPKKPVPSTNDSVTSSHFPKRRHQLLYMIQRLLNLLFQLESVNISLVMEDPEFKEDDIFGQVNFDDLEQIDWDNLFTELPEGCSPSLPSESSPPANICNSSYSSSCPDSVSSWIGQLENSLMKDDDDLAALAEPNQQVYENFLADIIVDSPVEIPDASTDKDSAVSDHGNSAASETEKETERIDNDDSDELKNNDDDDEDPDISKKRRRQLRNRDAAVRSRERKKMYVKDLEIKSKYLEGECRRLGRLLQCFIAENHALRLSLQNGSAFGVSPAKQESAVLLLESLLLGSLLWFLGIMCLSSLPKLPRSSPVGVPLENMEEEVAERGAGSKIVILSFVNSRRCKASRTRMKEESIEVLV